MPDPPEVSAINRYLFENPYPLGGLLLLVGAVALYSGLRHGFKDRLYSGLAFALLGLAAIGTGWAVVTSAEHARAVTRQLVAAVETGDTVAALKLFANDGALTVGSPQNPGFDTAFIRRQPDWVASRYTIESNRITQLDGYSQSPDEGVVHLACWTEVGMGFGATRWVVKVKEQPDGTWKIHRLTWISVQNSPARRELLR